MAEITASMVKDLREKTDAPMMECKKALTEAGGDPAKAEEILRVRLGNKASKAASRVAAEGVVGTYTAPDAKLGAIIEVNCETDFVAKNDDFLAFVRNLAALVAKHNPADVTALSALPLDGSTVDQVRSALVGRIGENMSIRRFTRLEAKGRLASYVHVGSKIGVMVDVVCVGRFYDFFEQRAGRWAIVRRQPIYEKDRLDPVDPSATLTLDGATLARFPEGYRHLGYLQSKNGFTVKDGLPGVRGPAVEKLYVEGREWLGGSARPGEPL